MTDTPEDVPHLTLWASDPAAPFALLAYASALNNKGADAETVARIKAQAQEFYKWQDTHGVIELGRSVMVNEKIDTMFNTHKENP